MTQPARHVALLGDSIFDNAIYVPDGPSVIEHLRGLLTPGWQATLVAHDGDVVADVAGQLSRVPGDASHLVLSIGGNDALSSIGLLSEPAASVHDALGFLEGIRKEFQRGYRAMLWQVLSLQRPLAVCTIYDAVPGLSPELQTALALFNDSIAREALAARVPIIDLRYVCAEAGDYSVISPIEPSVQGGGKIAKSIADWLQSQT
jgi:hypothetical protein